MTTGPAEPMLAGMSHRTHLRLAARASMAALLSVCLLAPSAFAAAGGGSSSFGGGGGGGGGGSSSFGGGGSSYSGGGSGGGELSGPALFFVIGIVVLVLGGGWIFRQAIATFAREKLRWRRKAHVEHVRPASAEAAQDDPAFAADVVVPAATQLFIELQQAWDARDREALRARIGPDLLVEWERRLDDFESKGWHNRVQVNGAPRVQYVGLVNRAADEEDRVTVCIEASLQDYVLHQGGVIKQTGAASTTTALREYWTLGKRDGRWTLLSIEQFAEGHHHLDAEIVTAPWSDSRVADEALVETVVADKLPEGFTVAEVADLDFDGDARAAALDLSLADPRFGPDVLEAAARRAVAAWAEAVDGEDAALEQIASPQAVRELLHPGDPSGRTRLVVRGPRVRSIAIEALDAATDPARMTIAVEVGGRRYVEDRDTAAVVSGSREAETAFTERWTLALSGPTMRRGSSSTPAPRHAGPALQRRRWFAAFRRGVWFLSGHIVPFCT